MTMTGIALPVDDIKRLKISWIYLDLKQFC
jgi:hypothetical protein